ncbi:hypothetical protein [Streptomyces albiflavescens]|nr:hypothetical protein [Streptomyces albiflavescens]
MIFVNAHADGRFLDEIATRGVPYILVNRRAGAHPSVTCDDCLGGRPAAEHLLALGHRRLAVIAGEPHPGTSTDRAAGFVDRWEPSSPAASTTRTCCIAHF